MKPAENQFQPNLNYLPLLAFAVLFVQLTHEFAHWSVGELLGYNCYLKLNSSGTLTDYRIGRHGFALDAAGPVFTIALAVMFFILIIQRRSKLAYPFLLVCFLHRLMASVFGVFAMHNDEARLSLWLGMPAHVLPFAVCALLFFLTYRASKLLAVSFKENIFYAVVIILYFFGIIELDHLVHIQLI